MSERVIAEIRVEDRHRQDLGDLVPLSASIRENGLLHPVVITEEGRLIAGQRRLAACLLLGWSKVPVTVAGDLSAASQLLAAERDENTCRLDMKPSEKVALGLALEELERPAAAERKGQRTDLQPTEKFSAGSAYERTGRTADLVGETVGMSRPTYNRAKAVVSAAERGEPGAAEAVKQMDQTGKVTPAFHAVNNPTGNGKPAEPHSMVTERQRQIAEKAKRRLWSVTSGLPDSHTFSTFDVRPALAVATPEETNDWVRMLGDSIKALRELRTRIQEGS